MSVTNTHKEYQAKIHQWTRCKDVYAGSDAVKGKGVAYLPVLQKQGGADYEAYKTRALFFGATKRTVQGLAGALYRKAPSTDEDPILDHLGGNGESAETVARNASKELLVTGRVGLMVDVRAEKPYVATYEAWNITNWQYGDTADGSKHLTRVVLREGYEIPGDDEFDTNLRTRYRVLEINESGQYIQRLFKPQDEKEEQTTEYVEVFQDGDATYPVIPLHGGRAFEFIPFYIASPTGSVNSLDEPPLMELVDVNLSHYRSSADLEHGAHFTALPTAWVAGFNPKTALYLGSAKAWVTSNVNAKAGFLEYSGQGLGAIVSLLEAKEKKMAVLGARLLEDQKKIGETEETVRLRMSGESSALMNISKATSAAMTQVLEWVYMWANSTKKPDYTVNTDFFDAPLSPQMLVSLMQVQQGGLMTRESFLFNIERGEMLPPGVTVEDEMAKLDIEPPIMVSAPGVSVEE